MTFLRQIAVPLLLVLPAAAAAQDAEVTSPDLTHVAGEYRDFNIVAEDGTFKVKGCCGDKWIASLTPLDRGFSMITVGDEDEDESSRTTYFPDEEAFPVTYVSGHYQGNQAMIEAHGAVAHRSEDRIVVVGTRIFVLSDWNGPNDFTLDTMLEAGWLNGVKRVRETYKVALQNPGPQYYDELHAFLDAGLARQAELLPAWTAANGGLIAERAAATEAVTVEIDAANAAYFASPEHAAVVQARDSQSSRAPSRVGFRNDTHEEVSIMTDGGSVTTVNAGSHTDYFCTAGEIYEAHLDDHHTWQKGRLLFDTEAVTCGEDVLASGL